MTYPPEWRQGAGTDAAVELMRTHPFALLISAHKDLRSTRVPFVTDLEDGKPKRLRAHLNGQNPQVEELDGASVLVVFSGPATYVSPHWRAQKTRGGTYDYEEVRVRGRVRVVAEIGFFRNLIDDLSRLIEPQYAEIGEYPVWQTSMAPDGYVERLFPLVCSFVIEVEAVEMISKLHQQFPDEDRASIADHLSRSKREDARAIAEKIRKSMGI